MKKFSLNKKRLSKVLALTLTVAAVVPNVPVQKSDAAASGKAAVTVPDPIATLDFADTDSYTLEKTIAKQLKFKEGKATEVSVWPLLDDKGDPKVQDNSTTFYSINRIAQRKKAAATTTVALTWNATGDVLTSMDAIVGSLDENDYEWEEIDLTPEVVAVTDDAVSGTAVSLKAGVTVTTQYPEKGKVAKKTDKNPSKWSWGDYNVPLTTQLQKTASYGGGAKITNPFAKSSKLYDASRYTMENILGTATETVKATNATIIGGPDNFLGDKKTARTAPEVKAGVTISFWGKVPENPETKEPEETSFIEFYNNESLVYQTDDLAKVWAATLYEENKDKMDEVSEDPTSLFYKGDIVTGKVVYAGMRENNIYNQNRNQQQAYQPRAGKDLEFKTTSWDANNTWTEVSGDAVVAYVANNGPFMYYNHSLANEYADADTGIDGFTLTRETNDGHSVKVLLAYGTCTLAEWKTVFTGGTGRNALLVETGEKNEDGEELFLMLSESTDIWGSYYEEDGKASNYAEANTQYGNYIPETAPEIEGADATKMGKMSRVGKGVTGYLSLATNTADFNRDLGSTGRGINENHSEAGMLKGFQSSNAANVKYTDVVPDTEWHYYTYTITDEWFQMYIDGEACNNAGVVINNLFNMGSGMFAPNGDAYRAKNFESTGDINRIYSFDKALSQYGWSKAAWGYGYIFGDTVMQFLTDENTKLYIGGKTQVTAEGAMVMDLAFYDESLTAEQVAAAYAIATGEDPGPEEGVDVLLGDVNNDEVIDSKDALEILKEDVQLAHSGTFIPEVADVNKDEVIDSKDALEILKHDVQVSQIPQEYIKVVLEEETPAE